MSELSAADRKLMAGLICADPDLNFIVNMSLQGSLAEFGKVCESPIEMLLGAAFHFAALATNFSRARGAMVYLNEPDRSRKPVFPDQWELVPQFRWESYRIDFAIFTPLPYPIFIECDGHDFHERTKEQAARDREKDRKIQMAGIPVLRFTGSQIHAEALGHGFEILNFIHKRLDEFKRATA